MLCFFYRLLCDIDTYLKCMVLRNFLLFGIFYYSFIYYRKFVFKKMKFTRSPSLNKFFVKRYNLPTNTIIFVIILR